MKAGLVQKQEFDAQEWPFEPGPRKVKMFVQEPAQGVSSNTGFMLVLHNWGGAYNDEWYLSWCEEFANRYNVIAISVNYLQSSEDWKRTEGVYPYDFGYLQAMDAIGAIYTVRKQLKDKAVPFNERRIYSMGGSGGGNVTQMAMKLAPRTFACGVDICGMPGLIDAMAYAEAGEGAGATSGYSRDPASPYYLSPAMREIRDFGNVEHNRIRLASNPKQKIVIVHGIGDGDCPVVPKIEQFQRMVQVGMDVDAHFLTPWHVDGKAVTNIGHSVGDRCQVVIRFADTYLKEDGALACPTEQPNDFECADRFTYPATGGDFVIDYTDYPTIAFIEK